MRTSHTLQNYPKTIHGDIKGRLFCYRNTAHHQEFIPYADNTTSRLSKKSSAYYSKSDIRRYTITECRFCVTRRPDTDEREPESPCRSNIRHHTQLV
jgi:hypothetical protein